MYNQHFVELHAGLAQLVEHRYRKPRVTGSSPAAGSKLLYDAFRSTID
ncbi:hypothetical protein NBRC111893_720 [Lentilactobacillus kosonis]|uniref:Uncharacterized protein n=1 Tax=Lentilactobacillus kosonis TaxID=2810561 RepID=A0A401FJN4_9LACO|nr:hypothetical protein NBRC111893_720 [Lentilactobacillus kosonis]